MNVTVTLSGHREGEEAGHTLECGGLALRVGFVAEHAGLGRPPELVVDVASEALRGAGASLMREPAALLIEGEGYSRYVQGWVRGVERYADAERGAQLRIHLVPTTLHADAGVQAGQEAEEPAYVHDRATWVADRGAEASVVAAGEDEEDTARFSRKALDEHLRRAAQERASEAVPDATVMLGGMQVGHALPLAPGEATAMLEWPVEPAPRGTSKGTELMTHEDVRRMVAEALGGPGPGPEPARRQKPEDDEAPRTARLTAEELAALRGE